MLVTKSILGVMVDSAAFCCKIKMAVDEHDFVNFFVIFGI